jgi:hypothetical protein
MDDKAKTHRRIKLITDLQEAKTLPQKINLVLRFEEEIDQEGRKDGEWLGRNGY